jgi:hypothetical protein
MPDSERDTREPALRLDVAALAVHHVERVTFTTQKFTVRRHRSEKREPDF